MVNRIKEHTPFLATTAIEEFWDTSKPLLFLGDWCLRYSRRSMWKPLQGEVVKWMWDESEKIYNAHLYAEKIYEEVLSSLSKGLNDIHGLNYSNRYWRIVAGPWLFHYIYILYDRYMSLSFVLKNYPKLTTYVLDENSFIVPLNTQDAIERFFDDPYNLQAYTKILSALGKKFPCKNYQQTAEKIVSSKSSIMRLLLQKLVKLFYKKNKIIISSTYFNKFTEFQIMVKTMGKVLPNLVNLPSLTPLPIDTKMRMKLQEFLPDYDEFTAVLKKMLPTDIPQSHIEAFKQITDQTHASYSIYPKAIASGVSWYFDESFKQWAACSAENGTKLLGIQYGGNYGSFLFLAPEEHELKITDKYYSWGWNDTDYISKVIPMPATKFAKRKLLGASKKKEGILFVGNNAPRYLYRLEYFSNNKIPEYLCWQLKFIGTVSQEMRKKIRFRIYQHDYGWDIRERLKDSFPDLNIEDWQTPFFKSLENCRLYVCDHLSTSFTEALSANKPTILFWDKNIYQLKEEAKPYYDVLHSVGILNYSPEDAAKTVNSVYDDIESWWDDPLRQSARRDFCDRFAKISDNPVKEWVREFKQAVND